MQSRYHMHKGKDGRYGHGFFIEHTDRKVLEDIKKADPYVWRWARIYLCIQAYPDQIKIGVIYDYETANEGGKQ